MDEEKQNDGFIKQAGETLKKGAKDQAKKAMQKVFKKVIMVIGSLLLKVVVPVLIIAITITSIIDFLDKDTGKTSKEASASAVDYSGSSSGDTDEGKSPNRIIVDVNNASKNGAYILTYEFQDGSGNILTEKEALKNIKKDLQKENAQLDITKFSDSELKVIGALMYNGLKIERYNEEELQALVIFVKADIASQSFDLREKDEIGQEVDYEEILTSDEVYGTLQIHKSTISTDENGSLGYKEVSLEYIPYGDDSTPGTFCYMAKHDDKEILNKFSLDEEGNLAIAKWGSNTTTYTYLDKYGNALSSEDMAKIDEKYIKAGETKLNIEEYPVSVDYKSYIKKYTVNYGFLSDLLVTTENVEFCLDIAQMAFNSNIVLNLKEELTTTHKDEEIQYTITTLVYDYVKYEVTGQEENSTETLNLVISGNGAPSESNSLRNVYGWSTGLPYTQTGENGGTDIYNWTNVDGKKYQLRHVNIYAYQRWSLYERIQNITYRDFELEKNNTGNYLINLYGNHITEAYAGYTIDEDYTAKEEFTYRVIEESTNNINTYDLDLSKIDSWYLKYEKEYQNPTVETKTIPAPTSIDGQFPEEKEITQEPTTDESIINSDAYVTEFINAKEDQYKNEYSNVECKVSELKIEKREKIRTEIIEYSGSRTKYSFGEDDVDTTQTHFKNLEYVNGVPSFTPNDEEGKPEVGFLYIYDTYIKSNTDLFLDQDAEKRLFELLEDNETTSGISDIIKFLLYVYDGVDRGVTDYDKNFKVIDIALTGSYGISPFGCNITKKEFIEAAQKQGETVLSGLAEEFYDICTSPEYDVNPALAYAWAAIESSYGKNAPYNNLFGMGIGNGMNSGIKYDSYADSIKGFCEWVVNAANPSSNSYSGAYAKAQEYATVNDIFKGTPENNIYVLFCRYAYLGDTHIANEPDFSNPAGIEYYKENGSTWGAGGRIQIYYMYECGGLYEGEYAIRCGHANGLDPTTLQEQADYAQYSTKTRVDLAKSIFGIDVFVSFGGIDVAQGILDAAEEIHTMYEEESWIYYTDLDDKHGEGAGLSVLLGYTIDGTFTNPNRVTCCATFVSQVLYKAGIITSDQFTNGGYSLHSPYGVYGLLTKYQAENLEQITDVEDLRAGDIVFMGDNNATSGDWDHVQIYAGNDMWYNAGNTGDIQRNNPYYDDNWDRRILDCFKSSCFFWQI